MVYNDHSEVVGINALLLTQSIVQIFLFDLY